MREKYLNNKGLSLVEVVVSALIVTMLLAGLYAVYINAKSMAALALHKTVAMVWAQSVLEDQKHGMRDAYTDPATPNTLSDDKDAGPPNLVNTTYGNTMIRHSVTITWDE